jgi:hypothetical protein
MIIFNLYLDSEIIPIVGERVAVETHENSEKQGE